LLINQDYLLMYLSHRSCDLWSELKFYSYLYVRYYLL